MKKIISIILAIVMVFALAACAGNAPEDKSDPTPAPAPSPEPSPEHEPADDEDTQNPIMDFIGEYYANRAVMNVEPMGDDGAKVSVQWSSSYNEYSEWVMSGRLDPETMTLEYSDCVKTDVVLPEDGASGTETVVYENGTGRLVFDAENGTVSWTDDNDENAENVVFMLDSAEPENPEYEAKLMSSEEAAEQIETAMQYYLEEAYGDKVFDARIYVEKVYTREEELANETLASYNLGADEYAFEVRYELKPSEGTDINELLVGNGSLDEDGEWVVDKYGVGVLRANDDGQPEYIITDFGTGF